MTSLDNEQTAPPERTPEEKQKRPRKRKSSVERMPSPSEDSLDAAPSLALATETPLANAEGAPPLSDDAAINASATAADDASDQMTAVVSDSASATLVSPSASCGGQLKAAREALGLSIHEVCSQLRLGLHQIQAIEQDDFAALPQKSIVRGFIRNYARLLKMDAGPILVAYQQLMPDEAPVNITVKSSAYTTVINPTARPLNAKNSLYVLLIVLVMAVLAYFYHFHVQPVATIDLPTTLSVTPATTETSPVSTQPEAQLPSISDTLAADAAASSSEPTPALQTGAQQVPNTPTTNLVTPATPAPSPSLDGLATTNTDPPPGAPAQTAAAATTTGTPAPSIKPNTAYTTTVITPTPATNAFAIANTFQANDPRKTELSFVVTEESWVRIEDAQGKRILSELLKPGAAKMMTVEKPLHITVGHANATRLLIDQQPYDLAQATRGRVAKIDLK